MADIKSHAISWWLAGYGVGLRAAPAIRDVDLFDGLGTEPEAIPDLVPDAHRAAYIKGHASAVREERVRRVRTRQIREISDIVPRGLAMGST